MILQIIPSVECKTWIQNKHIKTICVIIWNSLLKGYFVNSKELGSVNEKCLAITELFNLEMKPACAFPCEFLGIDRCWDSLLNLT